MATDTRELRAIVVAAIAIAGQVPVEAIHDDLNLFDLGLDSLSFADILIQIEDAAGAEVPAELLDGLLELGERVTLADLLRLLSEWDFDLAGTAASPPPPYGEVVVVERPSPTG